MGIDFKKLIPSNLRTGRWGELTEVIQSVFEEIKADKIDIIKTQYELENMTDEQILDLGNFFGYQIQYRDGYTSTTSYLRKEILSIIPRILNRTTSIGYKYIFNCFNLTGDVYPCFETDEGNLNPFTTWESSNELDETIVMDQEADNILFYSGGDAITLVPASTGLPAIYLDPDGGTTPATLDENTLLSTITRHILVQYAFNYIENADEFISTNTADSFYYDLWHNKRRTEVLHLEPKLEIDTYSGGFSRDLYTNYEETLSGYVESQHQQGNLTSGWVNYIQIGNGRYDTVSGVAITGVESVVHTCRLSDCQILSQGASRLNIRPILTQTGKFYDCTEIALMHDTSGCVYYAHFPEINYCDDCYSSIQFDISLV